MRFKSPVYSQASGSIAGITHCRDRGGLYVRQRRTPVNAGGAPRVRASRLFASLSARWSLQLGAGRRAAWETYAAAVPLADRLGEYRNIGGLGHYVRSNLPRLTALLSRVDDAPTIFNLGEFTAPTVDGFNAAANQYQLNYADSDAWVSEDGAAMLAYSSPAQNPCIGFFKKPFRSHPGILGNSGSPPPSPTTLAAAFNLAVGTRTFVQVRVTRADGRLSLPVRLRGPLSVLPPLPLEAFLISWNARVADVLFDQPLRIAATDPSHWDMSFLDIPPGFGNVLHVMNAAQVDPPATVRLTMDPPSALNGGLRFTYNAVGGTGPFLYGSTGVPVANFDFYPPTPRFVSVVVNPGQPRFVVTVSQPLVEVAGQLANWSAIYQSTFQVITAVAVAGPVISITATNGAPAPPPDEIEFQPPPYDLHNANGWPMYGFGRLL